MKRVLITGMSGVGKSTIAQKLEALGYKAVDADDGEWSEWVDVPDHADPVRIHKGVRQDRVWREDRIQRLLSTAHVNLLFVSGAASNQVKFYSCFDHIVLLTAPPRLILERLATRSNNPYGKRHDEAVRVLRLQQTVEPMLRRVATLEVNTSGPMDRAIEAILDHVES